MFGFGLPFSLYAQESNCNRGYVGLDAKQYKEDLEKARSEELRKRVEVGPYIVGADDELDVTVLLHPEMSGKLIVDFNGTISMPLSGQEISVAGLTRNQIRDKLREIYAEYIPDPVVVVTMDRRKGYKSKFVYVMGEIGGWSNSSGGGAGGGGNNPEDDFGGGGGVDVQHYTGYKIPFKSNIMTVRDAIVNAGMLGDDAAMRRVQVITPSYLGKPKVRIIDMYKIFFKGDLRNNILLNPGDIVYVPMTVARKITKTVTDIMAPINAVSAPLNTYFMYKGLLYVGDSTKDAVNTQPLPEATSVTTTYSEVSPDGIVKTTTETKSETKSNPREKK
jgi:polysaccharide export outer membrane protein